LTVYEETIAVMKDLRTVASHITNLGKVMNKSEDQQLKNLLHKVITVLQIEHARPNFKGKSTPLSVYHSKDLAIKDLIKYCENAIGTKKPEWQILAERNGWALKK
jgi:hypothetical protein